MDALATECQESRETDRLTSDSTQLQLRCIDPEAGRMLEDYCSGYLSADPHRVFVIHLSACRFCEDLVRHFDFIVGAIAERFVSANDSAEDAIRAGHSLGNQIDELKERIGELEILLEASERMRKHDVRAILLVYNGSILATIVIATLSYFFH